MTTKCYIQTIVPFLKNLFEKDYELFDKNIFRYIFKYTFTTPDVAAKRLEQRFLNLGHPFNSFSELLINHNSVIAGSFTLSCFLDDIKYGDIDIFVGENINFRFWYDFLENQGFTYLSEHTNGLSNINDMYSNPEYNMRLPANCSFTFGRGNDFVNLIQFDENGKSVKENIYEYFDLNICTICWDGKDFGWAPDLDICKLGERKMICRKFNNLDQEQTKAIEKRVIKYIERGFTIEN